MADLKQLEADLAGCDNDINEMKEALAIMPGDQGVLDTISELEALRTDIVSKIDLLKAKAVSPPAIPAVDIPVKHDQTANIRASPGPATDETRVFAVNETVLARYAADRQFYPATIISVMGSKTAPVYTVTFKGYSGTETVRSHEIRPIAAPKRKTDVSTAASIPPPPSQSPAVFNSGSVMSAPSTVAPTTRKETAPTLDDDESSKPKKKSRPNNSVTKSQANWKSWQAKTSTGKIAKVANKESMFRTGDKPGSKVGFTGSGQTMRKDADRTRHTYANDSSRY